MSDDGPISLRSERTGADSRHLTARRVASGDLWIEGQDLGPATDPVSTDGEYEWVWVVLADRIPELLGVLGAEPDADVLEELAARWTGPAAADLERLLRESGLAAFAVL